MPDDSKLLHAKLPRALEFALEGLNGAYDQPEQLLRADVSAFETLPCCVFAYFERDDVFYLNQAGRALLPPRLPATDRARAESPPIFWLEDDPVLTAADSYVASRRLPLPRARELVTLAWGKTWLEGAKFPILSLTGQPLATLFAGRELAPSQQIRQVAQHFQPSPFGFGDN